MTVLETYPDGTQLVEFETQTGEKQRFIKHEDGFSIIEIEEDE